MAHSASLVWSIRQRRRAWLTLAALCMLPAIVNAQSPAGWPGLWGPARDAAAAVNAAAKSPRAIKELWRRPTSGGYSEMAVAGDRVFTLELQRDADYAVALDARTGKERWRTAIGPTYKGHDGSHDGPIGTPAVDGSEVFAVGPTGHLVAMNAADGKVKWQHDLTKAFAAATPVYGFGTSPLVEGRLVIVQTGGAKSQGLLAFDRASGDLAWSAPHATSPTYSSAVAGTLAGTRQIVAAAGDRVFAVSPADGKLLWSVAGPGAAEEVSNSPIVLPDDRVLLTYWNESVLIKVGSQNGALTATEVWRSPRLRQMHGPTIYRDGFLYGFGGNMLLCLDVANGDVKWRQRTYEGSIIGLGAHLLFLGRSSGDLQVIRAAPDAFTEVLRLKVFTPGATSITGPSYAAGRIFLRNVEEMVALQIES